MTPTRDSPNSSGAPMRPARPAASHLCLLLLSSLAFAAEGTFDICAVGVMNKYEYPLAVLSFNSDDGSCFSSYNDVLVNPNTDANLFCNSDTACKLKLHGNSNDDYSRDSCLGTVLVSCGGYLEFYYGPDGTADYLVNNTVARRSLSMMDTAQELEAAYNETLGFEEGVTSSSGLRGVTSSSGLRGGAKGSKRYS
jgi:hypothetical protein